MRNNFSYYTLNVIIFLSKFVISRRTYQQKFMQVRKDKTNTKLAKDFETWKKKAKEKINDMKKGKLTENEVYKWLIHSK